MTIQDILKTIPTDLLPEGAKPLDFNPEAADPFEAAVRRVALDDPFEAAVQAAIAQTNLLGNW